MKRTTTMKMMIMNNATKLCAVALTCVTMATAVGCSGKKPSDPMAMNAGVTDISAVPPTPLAVQAPEPIAAPAPQPVVSDAPTQAAATAAPAGGKYTVQKGDTLWKIASASYGDGKQWQKIASANPGLSPSTLKAGQTIMLP